MRIYTTEAAAAATTEHETSPGPAEARYGGEVVGRSATDGAE